MYIYSGIHVPTQNTHQTIRTSLGMCEGLTKLKITSECNLPTTTQIISRIHGCSSFSPPSGHCESLWCYLQNLWLCICATVRK